MRQLRTVDPAAAVARTRPHTTLTETVSQTLIMAWRALKKMRRNPEQLFDVTLQPLLFTAMFAYIFGGAIAGSPHKYLPLLISGIVAQTVLTTCMSTGVQLREDMDKGVFDRFKALPMARLAPLAGPMVADLVRYLIAAGLTFVMGVIIGYRPGGGVLGVLGAIALAMFTGWALAWIFTFIGIRAKSARAVQGTSFLILFPLTFLSNAFVPVNSLPSWLAAFVKVNPVSHLVSAARALANQGIVTERGGLDAARGPGGDRGLRPALGVELPAASSAGPAAPGSRCTASRACVSRSGCGPSRYSACSRASRPGAASSAAGVIRSHRIVGTLRS